YHGFPTRFSLSFFFCFSVLPSSASFSSLVGYLSVASFGGRGSGCFSSVMATLDEEFELECDAVGRAASVAEATDIGSAGEPTLSFSMVQGSIKKIYIYIYGRIRLVLFFKR